MNPQSQESLHLFLLIIKGEGEDAVQVFEEVNTFVTVKGKDDFAIASGMEIIFSGVLCTNIPMGSGIGLADILKIKLTHGMIAAIITTILIHIVVI